MTPAVRKILASQKTFANHLADEEASQSSQGQPMAPPPLVSRPFIGGTTAASKVTKHAPARNKRPSVSSNDVRSSSERNVTSHTPGDFQIASTPSLGSTPLLPISPDDNEPLLKSSVPLATPASILDELLKAPPLSYAAARAAPPASGHPPRHFCEICGYWGRVKCMKCGARVCGLECKGAHDESRCLKFYA